MNNKNKKVEAQRRRVSNFLNGSRRIPESIILNNISILIKKNLNNKNNLKKIFNNLAKPTHNTPFERFANHLVNITKNNKNIKIYPNRRNITIGYGTTNNNYSYVKFMPSKNNRGVYISFGKTGKLRRMQKEGTKLRGYGVRAARKAGVPLYQYGQNVEKLLPQGAVPISTRIMRGLGAVPAHKIPGYGKMNYGSLVRAHRYFTRFRPV